jgi:hypothetical protein
MARTLKNGQLLADPVGAPDFTLPVSILAQVIESLKVDISAQSIPKLQINIAGISPGIVFNVAQSGTWTINIGAPLDASGNLKTSIQSSVTLSVNITNCTVTLNVNVTNSSLNVNVTNTSLNVYVTNSSLTVTVSGTVNVNVTNSTLTVTISGTPTVNIQTSGGANIVIDKLTQGAYTERRVDIYNHGATPTMIAYNYTYKRGKFFPRGCRGFLQRVWIYCDNTDTVAHTLTVKFSPAPGMGAVYTVTTSVAAGSSAAWRYIDVLKFWNYDSMFIWVSSDSNTYGRLGYDTGTPYDYYVSIDEATWSPDNYRYWIYVTISGGTVGDLPVSGTLNTVWVPATSSAYEIAAQNISPGTETNVITLTGAGYCDMIICEVATGTGSSLTRFRVYCDGKLALSFTPQQLYGIGFAASSPGISLLNFGVNDYCSFSVTKRFEFKNSLRISAFNSTYSAVVSVRAFANLIS